MDPQPEGEQDQLELPVEGQGQVGWGLQVREIRMAFRSLEIAFTCVVHLIVSSEASDIAEINLFKSMSLIKEFA